jgi:hypothetical protein
MLSVAVDYPFLIDPSGFSNVYFLSSSFFSLIFMYAISLLVVIVIACLLWQFEKLKVQ